MQMIYDLSAWLYGVKFGFIKETRHQVDPDDMEIMAFCEERNMQFIKEAQGTSDAFNNSSVISQLTSSILAQIKEAMESNRLRCQEIDCIISKDEASISKKLNSLI
jgi:hypothetical protein